MQTLLAAAKQRERVLRQVNLQLLALTNFAILVHSSSLGGSLLSERNYPASGYKMCRTHIEIVMQVGADVVYNLGKDKSGQAEFDALDSGE